MTAEKLHTRIIAGPVVAPFDGDVARVVELADGSGRIDYWVKGVGWTEAAPNAFTLDEFMPGACRPVSAKDAARLAMPARTVFTAPTRGGTVEKGRPSERPQVFGG